MTVPEGWGRFRSVGQFRRLNGHAKRQAGRQARGKSQVDYNNPVSLRVPSTPSPDHLTVISPLLLPGTNNLGRRVLRVDGRQTAVALAGGTKTRFIVQLLGRFGLVGLVN